MRLTKGNNVEVMNKDDDPLAWHPAQILSCNGHIYRVQYYSPGSIVGDGIELVPSKFVRPCPPVVEGIENCEVGDVVEVFDECTWRIAVVLNVLHRKREVSSQQKVLGARKQFLVRLLGCLRELNVDESRMRLRQTWHNGKWILVGKSSAESCHRKIPEVGAGAIKKRPQNIGLITKEKSEFRDSRMISSRSLKRTSPYASSIIEAGNGHPQKLRAIGSCHNTSKRVNAINDYPGDFLRNTSAQTIQEEPCYIPVNLKVKNSESNLDSDNCSVGSCSASNPCPNNNYIRLIPAVQNQGDNLCSDAESCSGSIPETKSSSEEVEVKIRWLELHAYRRTLEALFASGPLSWDQEAMLTNLRIVLHISNDQHLMELKQLVSTRTATKY